MEWNEHRQDTDMEDKEDKKYKEDKEDKESWWRPAEDCWQLTEGWRRATEGRRW